MEALPYDSIGAGGSSSSTGNEWEAVLKKVATALQKLAGLKRMALRSGAKDSDDARINKLPVELQGLID
eukprot:5772792-Alexandrium_andersonii.AAC.1